MEGARLRAALKSAFLSSHDSPSNQEDVLLCENRISASRATRCALGFSLRNLSKMAKSRSGQTFVVGALAESAMMSSSVTS